MGLSHLLLNARSTPGMHLAPNNLPTQEHFQFFLMKNKDKQPIKQRQKNKKTIRQRDVQRANKESRDEKKKISTLR